MLRILIGIREFYDYYNLQNIPSTCLINLGAKLLLLFYNKSFIKKNLQAMAIMSY